MVVITLLYTLYTLLYYVICKSSDGRLGTIQKFNTCGVFNANAIPPAVSDNTYKKKKEFNTYEQF